MSDLLDDNPYSRLLALKRMGVVPEYERIRTFSVAVVGVGGVGAVAAEMLARCGCGRIVLFDLDRVQRANMNRLFFRPEHVGQSKVSAAAAVLRAINPDVAVDAVCCDVTTSDGFARLSSVVSPLGAERRRSVDLLLCCVDNYEARMAVNQACTEAGVPWIESGVSETAVSGHVQFMLPGRTACFQCAPPLIVASQISESTIRRDGVCAASLPTTMGLVAALLAQAALKWLLGFGKCTGFVGYNALKDFFPRDVIRPNPECTNVACRARQAEAREAGLGVPDGMDPTAVESEQQQHQTQQQQQQQQHEENDWGIEVLEAAEATKRQSKPQKLAEGIEFAFEPTAPVQSPVVESTTTTASDVAELAAQLRALQASE